MDGGILPASFLRPHRVELDQKRSGIVGKPACEVPPPVAVLQHRPSQTAAEIAKSLESGKLHRLHIQNLTLTLFGRVRVVGVSPIQFAMG